jgi:hypothetical protein
MKILEYRYPVDALFTGCSLGNLSAFARFSASTELLGLWNASDNQYYAGRWSVGVLADGVPLAPVETRFGAVDQSTLFSHGAIESEQLFCLPFLPEGTADPAGERIVLCRITLRNTGSTTALLHLRHRLVFPGVVTDRFTKQPPDDQCAKRVEIRGHGNYCTVLTAGRPLEARVFGGADAWESLSADDTALEADYRFVLGGGESREQACLLAFSPDGVEEALSAFRTATGGGDIPRRASASMNGSISRSFLFTPDPLINRGMQWAKVNMLRVRHAYRTGESFTNDPPQDIVVIRDLGWFVLGADYLMPESSRKMLEGAVRLGVHEGGKLTEYFHADEVVPVQHDYHLNINDDTPLFVWGMIHHGMVSGDREFLSRHWDAIAGACRWIQGQIRDGLVRCTATGTGVWGICSWRNIIDGYTLSGAVTEINSECFLALDLAAGAATVLGRTEESRHFRLAADTLRNEINRRLLSDRTGMYVLNLDGEGNERHDVTGDLIFPVLARVADGEMSRRILARLQAPDFWTPSGMRTVAPDEANFDPDACYQLLGGVWPNLTAWTAFCLRASQPGRVAEAMAMIYRTADAPRPADRGYVVPGEFPERLHGTDFRSRGMTLSPWTPPTYLWLGIEGLLGVRCSWDSVEITPALSPGWGWIAVKDLPLRGESITAFLFEGILYATREVQSSSTVIVGHSVTAYSDDPRLFTIGLRVEDEILLFAAADEPLEAVATVEEMGITHECRVVLAGGEAVLVRVKGQRGRRGGEAT